MKGQTILYYGLGKGKTTAALGLAIRAVGAGMKAALLQFIKEEKSSEINALKNFKNLKIEVGGKGFYKLRGDQKPGEVHKKAASELFDKAEKYLQEPKIDVVVLDEILDCIEYELVPQQALVDFILKKPDTKTLVLTGHKAPKEIIKLCDVVTEMKKIKHIYDKGVVGQLGIDF